jgi:hypothetical protein
MKSRREKFSLKIMIAQKQLENMEYFSYLDSLTTNDARCTREIKFRFAMEKSALNKEKKNTLVYNLPNSVNFMSGCIFT